MQHQNLLKQNRKTARKSRFLVLPNW